jgi:hypothetical protein
MPLRTRSSTPCARTTTSLTTRQLTPGKDKRNWTRFCSEAANFRKNPAWSDIPTPRPIHGHQGQPEEATLRDRASVRLTSSTVCGSCGRICGRKLLQHAHVGCLWDEYYRAKRSRCCVPTRWCTTRERLDTKVQHPRHGRKEPELFIQMQTAPCNVK